MHLTRLEPGYPETPGPGAQPLDINFVGEDGSDGLLARLLRRKLLFGVVFLGVAAVVAGAYFYFPPLYKAEALVTVAVPDQLLAAQQPGGGQLTIGDTADLESQSATLASPMLLRDVLARPAIRAALLDECALLAPPAWKTTVKRWLHLKPPVPCEQQIADMTGMVDALRNRLNVSATGRSRVLAVTYTSPSPDVAKAVADGLVQAYLDLRLREKLEPREKAVAWLRDESKRVGDRLQETEARVQAFLQQQGVIKGQTASLASEQLTSLAQQITLAEAERAAAAGRMQQAKAAGSATSGVLGNRTVADVKTQLATIGSQIAQLSARYGSANPALAELVEQRRALTALLSQETGAVNRSSVADYEAADSRVKSLRQQLDALKQEVKSNDDAATQVAALERQATTDRELYVDLTKNLNQLQTSLRLVTPNAQLVSWAERPDSVFFPKTSIFALTGLILASGLAAAAALLRDRADRTVRTIAGLQLAANLRVLASIPHLPRLARDQRQLLAYIQRPSAFQEAIRALYAECLLVAPPEYRGLQKLRTVLITSADSGEGKSFTAMAFGHFAAAAGQRVLLLECDLRRPTIAQSLSLPAKPGVSEILRGRATPADCVQHVAATGLDILVAGRAAVDSAELLAATPMRDLLAWAYAAYDLVLIDTPPSRVLPDARILAPSVDGVLYCAQWGQSRTDAVIQGARDVVASGGRVLGLVLDRVQETQYHLYDPHSRKPGIYLAAQDG